jgi:hypothetical protein
LAFYFDNYGFYKISGGASDPDRNIYIAQWDNTFTYVTDSVVAYNGTFYKSLTNGNLNNTPDTSPLSWEEITGDISDPYYANFLIADWLPDGSGGFYIDYPATTHQQTQSKHVYAFISHNTVDPNEFIPFGYGDFIQYDNGDIRILSDSAFDGYIAITSFFVTGATPAGDYSLLLNKPVLNTDNATALVPDPIEEINGTIELHKISKTGDYDDLLNKPAIPILNTDNDSTLPVNNSESITGTIDLYKVAKTGYYDDLLEKPILPTTFYPMLNSNKITKNVKYERNPSIYEDTNGILYLWYVRADTLNVRTGGDVDSEMYKVYYQTSSDGGATWETPVLFPETLPITFSPRELSFMQDDLGLYHLFISNGCSGSPSADRLMHHFATSDLETWANENPIVITGWTSNPAQIGHTQVIFANSQFYMAFQQRSSNTVYFGKSVNGNTWTYVTLHAVTYMIPKICFKAGTPNKLFIVSTKGSAINLGVSIDDGTTWTKTDIITHAGAYDPMIMVYPNGNLLTVFAPNVGSDGQQLKSSISTDDGTTWSDLTTLTEGKKGTYEWWDYWPFAYNNGNETYVYYTSEYDSAGRSILPGEIYVMKIDDYIAKASKIENDSSITGDTVKDALETLDSTKEDLIGFTPENVVNKAIDMISNDDIHYPTVKAVNTAISASSGKSFYSVSTSAQLDAALIALRANNGGIVQLRNDISYTPAANRDITNITIMGSSNGVSMTKLTLTNTNYMYGSFYELKYLGIDPYLTNAPFRVIASTAFIAITALQHRGIPSKNDFDFGGFSVYLWSHDTISCTMNNTSNLTTYLYSSAVTLRNGGNVYRDSGSTASGTITANNLVDIASRVSNDSSVVGATTKDALNTLDTNKVNGTGISGTFTTVDLKTIIVVNGVITSIV